MFVWRKCTVLYIVELGVELLSSNSHLQKSSQTNKDFNHVSRVKQNRIIKSNLFIMVNDIRHTFSNLFGTSKMS